MNRHFTDEKTGIGYTLQDDYPLPCLTLLAEKGQHIGVWGETAQAVFERESPNFVL